MSTQNFDTLDTPENQEKNPGRVFLVSLVSLTFLASVLKIWTYTIYLLSQVVMTGSVCCFYLSASQLHPDNEFSTLFSSLMIFFFTAVSTVLYYFALKPHTRNVTL